MLNSTLPFFRGYILTKHILSTPASERDITILFKAKNFFDPTAKHFKFMDKKINIIPY